MAWADFVEELRDPGDYRRKKRMKEKRQAEVPDLYRKLLDETTLQPGEIDQTMDRYVGSGEFELPTKRFKMVPPAEGAGPANQVEEPIEPRRKVYSFHKDKGFSEAGPDIYRKDQIFEPDRSENEFGWVNYVDRKTGAVIRREPTNKKGTQTILIGDTGGGSKMTPADKAQLETLKAYDAFFKDPRNEGVKPPEELRRRAVSAGQYFGFDTDKMPIEQGIVDWIRGAEQQFEDIPSYNRRPGAGGKPAPAGGAQGQGDVIQVQTSDGGTHTIFRKNLEAARKRDPKLKVLNGR